VRDDWHGGLGLGLTLTLTLALRQSYQKAQGVWFREKRAWLRSRRLYTEGVLALEKGVSAFEAGRRGRAVIWEGRAAALETSGVLAVRCLTVVAARDEHRRAIGGAARVDVTRVALEEPHPTPRLDVPQRHRFVGRGRDGVLAIGQPVRLEHGVGVPLERQHIAALTKHLPEEQRFVVRSGQEMHPVRAKLGRVHRRAVAREQHDWSQQFGRALRASRHQRAAARARRDQRAARCPLLLRLHHGACVGFTAHGWARVAP